MIPILVEALKQAGSEVEDNRRRIKALEELILASSEARRLNGDGDRRKSSSPTQTQIFAIIGLLLGLLILKMTEFVNSFHRKRPTSDSDNNIVSTA